MKFSYFASRYIYQSLIMWVPCTTPTNSTPFFPRLGCFLHLYMLISVCWVVRGPPHTCAFSLKTCGCVRARLHLFGPQVELLGSQCTCSGLQMACVHAFVSQSCPCFLNICSIFCLIFLEGRNQWCKCTPFTPSWPKELDSIALLSQSLLLSDYLLFRFSTHSPKLS